jgi:ATP adenylyltransferase
MSDDGLFHHHLQAQGKLQYFRGNRPNVPCILCAVRDSHPEVTSLKVYEEDILFISLNLYPYNPGHLMVIPKRHVEKFEDLSDIERNRIFEVTIIAQKMLQEIFQPTGFNVGYNQGAYSGASINHIHIHIVPRYKTELGFIDIIGQTKIIIQDVNTVYALIQREISRFLPKNS